MKSGLDECEFGGRLDKGQYLRAGRQPRAVRLFPAEELLMNSMVKIALRFRSDLAELIKLNRRRSTATLRIWRLKIG